MIGWKITRYFLDQSEVKPKLHVTSSLMRTCLPGLAPAHCICREFWLVYLIVCSFCDWPEKNGFRFVFTTLFRKGLWENQYVMCIFFFLSIGLSASPSKSDPFAMDPFQSTFPSSKVSAMIILHFHLNRKFTAMIILHFQSSFGRAALSVFLFDFTFAVDVIGLFIRGKIRRVFHETSPK